MSRDKRTESGKGYSALRASFYLSCARLRNAAQYIENHRRLAQTFKAMTTAANRCKAITANSHIRRPDEHRLCSRLAA